MGERLKAPRDANLNSVQIVAGKLEHRFEGLQIEIQLHSFKLVFKIFFLPPPYFGY